MILNYEKRLKIANSFRWIGILDGNPLCCFVPHPAWGGFTILMAYALSDALNKTSIVGLLAGVGPVKDIPLLIY